METQFSSRRVVENFPNTMREDGHVDCLLRERSTGHIIFHLSDRKLRAGCGVLSLFSTAGSARVDKKLCRGSLYNVLTCLGSSSHLASLPGVSAWPGVETFARLVEAEGR